MTDPALSRLIFRPMIVVDDKRIRRESDGEPYGEIACISSTALIERRVRGALATLR